MVLLAAAGRVPAQEQVHRTFAVDATVSLRIWLPSGRVRLETWDKDSVRAVGYTAKGSHFFGGGGQRSAKLGVDQQASRANSLARGELVVTVPRRAQVWIKATDAVIESAHTYGDLEILTVGGRVTVVDARAVVSIETIEAPITLRGGSGTVRLHSGGGAVALRDISGELTVSTIRGAVELVGDSIGDAQIETVGGAVRLLGRLRWGAFVDLQTHDGTVMMWLPIDGVPLLELSSRSGEVSNALGRGNAKLGRIVVRSFRGGINAMPRTDVEGGKQRPTP